MLKKLGIESVLLSKYEKLANETFDSNFVSKQLVVKNAKEAGLCVENIKLIEDFMDYADEDIKRFIWLFYYVQFKSEEEFFKDIWVLDDIPMPQATEKEYPGCIKAVTYLLAAENLKNWLKERNFPLDMMEKSYYSRYRRFVELNIISHNTYGLCRLSPFLYAYGKPYTLAVKRLTFQLLPFKDYAEMYEDKNGKRLFIALPNYTYNDKGLQDEDGFVPKYEKKDNMLFAHVFGKNGAISLKHQEIDLDEYKLVYKPGDLMFTIHIPETGGKLSKEVVRESLVEANKVLRKHFSHFETFVCQTWFLDPALRGEIIKDSSNMADFADMFDIICGPDNNNHSLFEHVFNTVRKPLEELSPKNSFQEKMLERAKRGEKIYWSYGVLKKNYNLY